VLQNFHHADRGEGVEVEVRGVDVYDPTTGEVRSGSTDDIACWFVDINYNGESFFVRHAYFTGGNDPYTQLRRALRVDIDEDAWRSLYSTVSRPFPVPETGKIAVKVINHYGDEVLQVCTRSVTVDEPTRQLGNLEGCGVRARITSPMSGCL
jgi:adenine-specific DNA-methyltransferase